MNKKILIDIINNCEIDDKNKIIFKGIFSELIDYNNKALDNIKNNIENSQTNISDVEVITKLIDKKDLYKYENIGFKSFSYDNIIDKNCLGSAFLKCDYETYKTLCQKIYNGVFQDKNGDYIQFKYKLSYNLNLIKEEKIFNELREKYNFTNKIINSPYSRRYVDIIVLDSELDIDTKHISLNLEENNLDQYVLFDKILISNIYAINKYQPDDRYYVNTIDGGKNYVHEFEYNKSHFIYLQTEVLDIVIENSKIKFFTKEPSFEFNTFTINDKYKYDDFNLLSENIYFSNKITEDKTLQRLRSKSHLFRAINQFTNEDIVLDILTKKDKYIEINSYDLIHKSELNQVEEILISRSEEVYILFENKNDIYFTDKCNYILENLNHMYPEFKWIGVC
ncbi:MAG: hypothetical protein R3Y64_08945 [Peptostreptococcaceae bacterium]